MHLIGGWGEARQKGGEVGNGKRIGLHIELRGIERVERGGFGSEVEHACAAKTAAGRIQLNMFDGEGFGRECCGSVERERCAGLIGQGGVQLERVECGGEGIAHLQIAHREIKRINGGGGVGLAVEGEGGGTAC